MHTPTDDRNIVRMNSRICRDASSKFEFPVCGFFFCNNVVALPVEDASVQKYRTTDRYRFCFDHDVIDDSSLPVASFDISPTILALRMHGKTII